MIALKMVYFVVFISVLQIVYGSCPSGFELVREGQCRGLGAILPAFDSAIALNDAITKCGKIQAQPVIILNSEEQEYWRPFGWEEGNNLTMPIGLECRTGSKQWQWIDGSAVSYKPTSYNPALDTECTPECAWTLWTSGYWNIECDRYDNRTTTIYCIKQLQQPAESADGCDGFEDDSEDGVCYQIGEAIGSWHDAQITCKKVGADLASIHSQQENSFIRRLAVSRGAVNGLFIGGISSGNNYSWIDGTNWDYANFATGYPMAALGDCLQMDTVSTSGEWKNADCSSAMSVAACMRKPRTHKCQLGPWKEGEIITSPGFPFESSIPCEFMLNVPLGKRIELEIIFLEANTCCDRLDIYENTPGENILAILTGELNGTIVKTKSSNLMRVSWKPQRGVNVRGVMFTFRAVNIIT